MKTKPRRLQTILQTNICALLLLPSLMLSSLTPPPRDPGHKFTQMNSAVAAISQSRPLAPIHKEPGTTRLSSPTSHPSDDDWWNTVQKDIRRREYHVRRAVLLTADGMPGYRASNRAQNLRANFLPSGIRITPRTSSHPVWTFGLALAGLEQDGAATRPTLSARENRVAYQYGQLTIQYTNDKSGLEQTLEIRNPQSLLEYEFSGNLIPHLTGDPQANPRPDNQTIEFTAAAGGTPVLRYTISHAADANGHRLPLTLALSPGEKKINISIDAPAAYPITLHARITALPSAANWTGESDQDGANLGYAISTAGDVNGDGYSDLIVGAPWFDGSQTEGGAVFVYHGSTAGLPVSPTHIIKSDQAHAHFGSSLSIAGDVNGDGYADIIVGAPDYDTTQADAGAAFAYHGSAAGLDTSLADWTATGGQENAHFGAAVSTAGDADGDGYTDVIVGAPDHDTGDQTDGGAVFAYHGSASGLNSGPADWTATGTQKNAHFGAATSIAGDVDGDGYADVIIGAPGYTLTGTITLTGTGRAYVYLGGAGGFSNTQHSIIESGQADAHFGAAVSTAGDVNGDGYSDVIAGAPGYGVSNTTTMPDVGQAHVYLGSAGGLITGAASWTAQGNQTGANLGAAVSTAGDVNGDGYGDVIVGAPGYDDVQPNQGAAYVYLGGPSGLDASPAWTGHPVNQPDAHFGAAVSTAGDVNGDGHSDLAIGATGYDHDHTDEGGAFIYHGSPGGLAGTAGWSATGKQNGSLAGWAVASAGDVNGDGYGDVIVGVPRYDLGQTEEGVVFLYTGGANGPSPTPAWTGQGGQDWAWFGQTVAAAGDVNGDGYGDVIVGAPHYDGEQFDDGKAFVYHGGPGGLDATPAWTGPPEGQGTAVFGVSARFGAAVAAAGDVNGDGYGDVIVTANGYDAEATNEGAAFVYHGGPDGLEVDPTWAAHPLDQAFGNFGRSASSAGDVNGDGYSDVIVGAPWHDNPLNNVDSDRNVYDGTAFIYHGSPTGLDLDHHAWKFDGLFTNSEFGLSVSTAGDVNGDGYSDVIIGAYKYNTTTPWREGAVFVYHGSAAGITSSTANWTATGRQREAKFGISVSTAGDVNGDGYSDVVVGASNYSDGETQEGAAFVYYGSAAGLAGAAGWIVQGNQKQSGYGFSVSTAGDVNGDGYGDVIVGAPSYDHGRVDDGAAFVYLGNEGRSRAIRPGQLRTGSLIPIAPLGLSDSINQVRLQLTALSPLGREMVALQWQIAPLGVPFTATAVISGVSPSWSDVLTTGIILNQTVGGLTGDTVYRWRVRTLYRPGNPLGQVAGRWLYPPWNGPQEADFRTPVPSRFDRITGLPGHPLVFPRAEQFFR